MKIFFDFIDELGSGKEEFGFTFLNFFFLSCFHVLSSQRIEDAFPKKRMEAKEILLFYVKRQGMMHSML